MHVRTRLLVWIDALSDVAPTIFYGVLLLSTCTAVFVR